MNRTLSFLFLLPLFALAQPKDSLELTEEYTKTGKQYFKNSDFITALDHFFKALRIAEKIHNEFQIASAHNNISTAYMETGKYAESEKYAQKAILLFTKLKKNKELGNAYNSLANTYYMQGKDSLALQYYLRSLQQRKTANDSAGLFAAYKNLGAIHHAMNDTLKSIEYMEQSVNYLTRKDDSSRWFSAYMTLGEVYVYTGQLEKGKAYLDKSANFLPAVKAYHKIDDYHHALYRYYYTKKDYEPAFEEYVKYEEYKDSIENIEKSRQLLELNVQYETEKKEQQNKLLNEQSKRQQLLLILTVVGILALLLIIALVVRARNQREKTLKLEAQLRETLAIENLRKEKERISRDLHDNVGAQLSYLITNLDWISQHPEAVQDKTEFYSRLHSLSESGRNAMLTLRETIWAVSHKELSAEDFADRFKQYVLKMTEFNRELKIEFKEHIGGNVLLSPVNALNTFRICQEAFHNALRHSQSTHIIIEFKTEENDLCFVITDNGIGFDANSEKAGHYGLQNMKSRAEETGGTLTIESAPAKGTRMELKLKADGNG